MSKRIGCIVYDRNRDCCTVRYNGDRFAEIPENAEFKVLNGNKWIDAIITRSLYGYWILLGVDTNRSPTGTCILIDVDNNGRYLPKIKKNIWE